jgi:Zn-dependent protease
MRGPLLQLISGLGERDITVIFSSLLVIVLLLLVCFPVHEFAHAYVATKLGDDTARLMGRVTLNPLVHLDLFGSLLFLIAGFGWAKPVPVNPYRLNGNPRTSYAIVALAGPASNVILAILFALLFRLSAAILPPDTVLASMLFQGLGTAVLLNLFLALFNLIPIPPLDGSAILVAVLPDAGARLMEQLRQYGFLILMLLVVAIPSLLSQLIAVPAFSIARFLLGT